MINKENKKDIIIAAVIGLLYSLFFSFVIIGDSSITMTVIYLIISVVLSGHIATDIKSKNEDGTTRYDFQYENKRGYKTTIEGLSHKFNPEFWNYAKLISGTMRHGMPIDKTIELISSLQLDSAFINSWKNGVARALKRYVEDGTTAKGHTCDNCDSVNLIYQEGCLTCKDCGSSKCG